MYPGVDAAPIAPSALHGGITVFDTIYNPASTKLLTMAKQAGCKTQNGLRMLLYQGLASFKLWTGVEAPEDIFDIEELQRQAGEIREHTV
jgi:shikimate dehydrogenase